MLIDHYSHVLDPSAGEVKCLQADATMDGIEFRFTSFKTISSQLPKEESRICG